MEKCHLIYILGWLGAGAILLFSTSTLESNLIISCEVKDVHTHQIISYINIYNFSFSTILPWSWEKNFNSHLYIFLGEVAVNVKGFCFVLPDPILPCEKHLVKTMSIHQALPVHTQFWHKLAWAWQHGLCWPPAVVLLLLDETNVVQGTGPSLSGYLEWGSSNWGYVPSTRFRMTKENKDIYAI